VLNFVSIDTKLKIYFLYCYLERLRYGTCAYMLQQLPECTTSIPLQSRVFVCVAVVIKPWFVLDLYWKWKDCKVLGSNPSWILDFLPWFYFSLSQQKHIILECLLSFTVNNIKPLNFHHQPWLWLLGLLGGLRCARLSL